MTLGVGRRAGTRERGHTGIDEGSTMMMITITVILEGWKSRHALLLIPDTQRAADFSCGLQYDQRLNKLLPER